MFRRRVRKGVVDVNEDEILILFGADDEVIGLSKGSKDKQVSISDLLESRNKKKSIFSRISNFSLTLLLNKNEYSRISTKKEINEELHQFISDNFGFFEKYLSNVKASHNQVIIRRGLGIIKITPPNSQDFFWSDSNFNYEKITINENNLLLEGEILTFVKSLGDDISTRLKEKILLVEVPDNNIGLLKFENKLLRVIEPGKYYFWNLEKKLSVDQVSELYDFSSCLNSDDNYEFLKLRKIETPEGQYSLIIKNDNIIDLKRSGSVTNYYDPYNSLIFHHELIKDPLQPDCNIYRMLTASKSERVKKIIKDYFLTVKVKYGQQGYFFSSKAMDKNSLVELNAGEYLLFNINPAVGFKLVSLQPDSKKIINIEVESSDGFTFFIDITVKWKIVDGFQITLNQIDIDKYLEEEVVYWTSQWSSFNPSKEFLELDIKKNLIDGIYENIKGKLEPYESKVEGMVVNRIKKPYFLEDKVKKKIIKEISLLE